MKGITAWLSVGLVLLMSSLVVLQPMSAVAADCSSEKAAVDALGRNISRLTDDLQKQLRNEDAARSDLASDLDQINKLEQTLQGESDLVRQELDSKGLWAALKTLGVQVAAALALGAVGPEGWPLLSHTVVELLELVEKANTAREVADLFQEASEASSMMDEMAAQQGSLDAAQTFADENDLTQMQLMLTHLSDLAALTKSFDRDWQRLKEAANSVKGDQALLDQFAKQLAAALEALYACLDQPGPEPSPCEGQVTNPNGAGVCR